jgi:signal transduction histidine kinase
MSTRSASLVVGLLMALSGIAGTVAQEIPRPPTFDFDIADFVESPSPVPPGDNAAWRPVILPDNWYVSHPGKSGRGWYRMSFSMPLPPFTMTSLYAPRGSARNLAFFLNDKLVTTTGIQADARGLNWDEPMRFAVAPPLFRTGPNVLYARLDATADLRQGLSRISIGSSYDVMPRYFLRYTLQVDSLRMLGGAALFSGLLALGFWNRRRDDDVILWFAIIALVWTLMSVPWFQPRFGQWGIFADLMVFPLRFAYAAPLLIFCLRVAGKRLPTAEIAIWLFTALGAVLIPLGDAALRSTVITVWSVTYLIALVLLLGWLVRTSQHSKSFWLLAAATALAVALNAHDLARWMGWANYDDLALGHFHVPLILLAIGVSLLEKHFQAVDELARAKAQLEVRVQQKTREIEASYQQLRVVEQERALVTERSRIMADMHDGVGASLLSLLGLLRSGRAVASQIERRVREALLELRLTVDSLEPVDGDLGVVLGNVRHRMREPIEESGVRLFWEVGELPSVDYLNPRAILAIQRIILEAIANALQHAHAVSITVRTDVNLMNGQLLIEVKDDGHGFDPGQALRGRGLDNMRNRARSVGASVELAATNDGTSVRLTLPLAVQRAAQ